MADTKQEFVERALAQREARVHFLARKTGVTEEQARELIDLIGSDENSLLREARFLARNQR